MIKFIPRVVAVAVASLSVAPAVQSETLEQIYQQALRNDHEFKAAQAAFQAGQENTAIGRSALLPDIGGNYQYARRETTTDNGEFGSAGETTLTTKTLGAELTQPLFDLSAWYTYKRGKSLTDLAEAQFELAKQNLIIRTSEAYFDALYAVDELRTALAEESALEQQLEQTRQRYEVGLTAITEVHEAQAAYDSAVAQRLAARGNLGIAFEALEALTGQSYQQLAPLEEDFPVIDPIPADRHAWVEMAMAQNNQLQVAALSAEAAERAAKSTASRHLPTVYGRLAYSDTTTDREEGGGTVPTPGADSAFIIEGEEKTAAVVLEVPLFAGGGISADRRQTRFQALEAQEEFFAAQRDVIQDARSLHLSVETSVASVKARRQAIISSRSALEATRAGYEVGTRDLVDVLNAQRSLYSAQRDYFDALYTYVLNSLRLKETAGTLDGEDVNELNQWLNEQNQIDPDELDIDDIL